MTLRNRIVEPCSWLKVAIFMGGYFFICEKKTKKQTTTTIRYRRDFVVYCGTIIGRPTRPGGVHGII